MISVRFHIDPKASQFTPDSTHIVQIQCEIWATRLQNQGHLDDGVHKKARPSQIVATEACSIMVGFWSMIGIPDFWEH